MPEEPDPAQIPDAYEATELPTPLEPEAQPRPLSMRLYPWLVAVSFAAGLLISYRIWGAQPRTLMVQAREVVVITATPKAAANGFDVAALEKQINPPAGYELPASYGDLGPRLLQGGAIDYDAFAAVYQQGGDPLTDAQVAILKNGADQPIVITQQNAHFLLNFFWAVGLANKNSILTNGPIMENSGGQIDRFASTGGWTLGAKPIKEIYASVDLIPLTELQQSRVEEVAAGVYRPCCGNATIFPDCNHGMAMLGLLELMASQNASVDQMFTAAKYVNAYWFPQQTLETAIYLKASRGLDFIRTDPRTVTGEEYSSGAGSQQVHAALQKAGLLPEAPDNGGSCGS